MGHTLNWDGTNLSCLSCGAASAVRHCEETIGSRKLNVYWARLALTGQRHVPCMSQAIWKGEESFPMSLQPAAILVAVRRSTAISANC